jgi:hypothetical protein
MAREIGGVGGHKSVGVNKRKLFVGVLGMPARHLAAGRGFRGVEQRARSVDGEGHGVLPMRFDERRLGSRCILVVKRFVYEGRKASAV